VGAIAGQGVALRITADQGATERLTALATDERAPATPAAGA
jgi:hypothetical protein